MLKNLESTAVRPYQMFRSRLTRLVSGPLTSPAWVRFLFLLVDFLVRMWLLNACLRLILPVPVSLNRFFAPDIVFIFGITLTSCPE